MAYLMVKLEEQLHQRQSRDKKSLLSPVQFYARTGKSTKGYTIEK